MYFDAVFMNCKSETDAHTYPMKIVITEITLSHVFSECAIHVLSHHRRVRANAVVSMGKSGISYRCCQIQVSFYT